MGYFNLTIYIFRCIKSVMRLIVLLLASSLIYGCHQSRLIVFGDVSKLKESVVYIETPAGYAGSGFILYGRSYRVITAKHVLDELAVGDVVSIFVYPSITDTAEPKRIKLSGSIIYLSSSYDIGVIAVDGGNLPQGLRIVDVPIEVGMNVLSVGFPAGIQPAVVSLGYVVDYDEENVYHSSTSWYGSSGGPLILTTGEVIGINVMMMGTPFGGWGDRIIAIRGRHILSEVIGK